MSDMPTDPGRSAEPGDIDITAPTPTQQIAAQEVSAVPPPPPPPPPKTPTTAADSSAAKPAGASQFEEDKARIKRVFFGLRRRPGITILTLALVALVVLYGVALLILRPDSTGTEIRLDTLVKATAAKEVTQARFLDEDARVTGTIERLGQDPRKFWTAYPRSDAATNDLLKDLLASDAKVTVESQSGKALVRFLAQFLLPLVILANIFALLFLLIRGRSTSGAEDFKSFSQLGDRRLSRGRRTTFADVASSEDAVAELSEVRDYLAKPADFERMGALPPKGVLLVGPPGCGKTLLARAVAGEADAEFLSISGSEFVESLVGVGAARVRDLFRQAREHRPTIVFIDELDAVGRQRGAGLGGGHDEREQTLNELLVQMDGFAPNDGVAVLAATNRIDILDPALLRPGRFDRHITVERPDRDGRFAILQLHAKGKPLADAARDLGEIARQTPGFTGADLANVLNEAALLAVREKSSTIGRRQLDEAVDRVVAGPKRRGTLMSSLDKRRIAVHEAGHAVVAAALGKGDSIQKVSIISRGRGIGHLALLTSEALLPTREDMENQITIAMAGRAAEELVLHQPSVGSEADLERATNTARDMAGRYGMSPRLGPVRLLREQREVFLGRDYLLTRDVSQPTLEHLDAEVRRLVEEQEGHAHAILVANHRVLSGMADALVDQETVQDEQLGRLISRVLPYDGVGGVDGDGAASGDGEGPAEAERERERRSVADPQ
jgi:cell division protease FtsH